MSVITDFPDYRHLMMAHYVEMALTSKALNEFREAYVASDGSTTVPFSVFYRAISGIVRKMPVETRSQFFNDHFLRMWFTSLDPTCRGVVDYSDVVETLGIAAAMRRHYTLFARGFTVRRWDGPAVAKIFFVDAWRRLAVCTSERNDLQLYSPSGVFECSFNAHTAAILHCVYLRPLGRVCTVGCDRMIILWDHKKLTPFASMLLDVPGSCVAFDTDTGNIVVARLDGTLQAVSADLTSTQYVSQSRHDDWIRDVLFVEELRMIITASVDRTVGFWTNDGVLCSRRIGHTRGVHHLAYSITARLLFSAGKGKEILVWNPFSQLTAPLHALQGHDKEIAGLFSDLLNHCVISIDVGMTVIVWDALRHCIINTILPSGPNASLSGSSSITSSRQLGSSAAPVRACCQNAATREIVVISDQIYRLSAIVAPLRPPKLGTRLLSLHFSSLYRVVICSTIHSIYMFAAEDGELCKTFDNPFGASTSVVASSLCGDGLFFAFAQDGHILAYPISLGKYRMRMLTPRRVAQVFASPVHWAFPARDGIAFLSENGAGALMSMKMGMHELHLGPANSVSLQGPIAHAAFCQSINLVCVVHGGKATLWHALKAATQSLVTLPDCPVVDACFVDRRNALVIAYATGIDIFNCGTFVNVVHYSDITRVLVPLRSSKSMRGLKRSNSVRQLPQVTDVPAVTAIKHCYDDVVVCMTSECAQTLLVDISSSLSRFYRSQTRCIVALPTSELTLIHNTHFAVKQDVKPITGLTTTVCFALDKRTNTSVVLKFHQSPEAHDREVGIREALGDSPFVVRFYSSWSSNAGLPPGTAPRGIVMEQGTPLRNFKCLTPEETDNLIVALLYIVKSVHDCGYYIGNLRPRSIIRVGDAWKLCAVDSLLTLGSPAPCHCTAAYCPPELCGRCLRDSGPVPTTTAANMWSLAVVVYELIRARPVIQCNSEAATLQSIRGLLQSEIKMFVEDVRYSVIGHLVVKGCLQMQPDDRADASKLISEAAVFGNVLQVEHTSENVAASIGDEAMPLPHNLVSRVDSVRVDDDDPECALVLTVPNINWVTSVASDPVSRLLMCADCDVNGEGSVHLVDAWGGTFGFLPRPELGEDEAGRWVWPHTAVSSQVQSAAFLEEAECEIVELSSGGDIGDSSMKLAPLQTTPDMRPPPGWKLMSPEELKSAVLDSIKVNTETVDDVVARFVNDVLKRAPFFRNGCITGDPLPLYAERPMVRMNPFQYARLKTETTGIHEAKRAAAIRKQLSLEFGVGKTRPKEKLSSLTDAKIASELLGKDPLSSTASMRKSSTRRAGDDFFSSVIRGITPDPSLFLDANVAKAMQEQFDAHPELEREVERDLQKHSSPPGKRRGAAFAPTSSSLARGTSLPALPGRRTTLPPRRGSSFSSIPGATEM